VSHRESRELSATLIELMELPGPTGQEEPVLAWCRERWSRLGAEVTATPIGNVLGRIAGSGPRLLIQAHADEIGFVVKSIDERGFLWLADGQAGSRRMHFRFPVGQPALVIGAERHVEGVFAAVTGHMVSTLTDDSPRLDANDLFVDLGVRSRADAESAGAHVGAGVIWNPPARRLGQRVIGKAIDDRVGLALMTHLLERLNPARLVYDLTLAATVQEEIGLVGALSLGRPGEYDLAIAVDNGPVADYPGLDPRELPLRLGEGPALIYKDNWTHYDRRVIERMRAVGAEHGIALQSGVYQGFGSDGAALIRAGLPSALLAIGTRYTHSAFEMADLGDVEAASELLLHFVETPSRPLPPGPA
jgi:endoglucanase